MKANLKNILEKIQERQLETFCSEEDFRHKKPLILPTNRCGLYWIWSNLSDDNLQKMSPEINDSDVPISKLVTQRHGLTNICRIAQEIAQKKFTIVYNGIGGYGKTSGGLRERILQEFKGGKGTGSLNLSNRKNFKTENWAISFFDFDNPIIKQAGLTYSDDAEDLERDWRIHYGTPKLTRR